MDGRDKYKYLIMKIFQYVLLLLLMVSCAKPDTQIDKGDPMYSGVMNVVYEGEDFEQNGIEVQLGFNADSTMMDMKLVKVKFVPAMPVRIDVTVMEIPVVKEGDGEFSFYGDGIVPWAMGGPYDTYRVDSLEGKLNRGKLEFSMMFYNTKKQEGYPTSYSGSN